MPMLVRLAGRPVKKKIILPSGMVKVWFFAAGRGEPGESQVLTQEEWNRGVERQWFAAENMPDVRAMAAG